MTLVVSLLLTACNSEPESFSVLPPAVEIASPAGNHSAVPNLVTDGSGSLLLSWTATVGEQSTMYFSTLKGDAWLPPVKIAAGTDWFVNWADVPEIAGDGAGNLIANFLVKSADRSFGYNVNLVRSSDSGQKWSDPVIPHDDRSATEHGFVTFLPMGDGQFFIAWLDGRNNTASMRKKGGSQTLRAAFIDNQGNMNNEGPVDLRVCDCCQPSAVKMPHGPAIVYRDRSGAEIRDISITWWDNGRWAGPFSVAHDNWEIYGCPVDGPNADIVDNTLVVAWFTAAQGKPMVQVAFSDDGGRTFGIPIRVDGGRPVGRPDVTLLDSNTAMVSWLESDKKREQLIVRKVFKQGRSESPQVISKIARSSGFPQMSNSNGKVYLAWTDGDRLRTAALQP
jgi:hypothetical protein